jgi:hypothetical protein
MPRSVDQYSVQGQPNKQYQAPLPTFVADHPFIGFKGVKHNKPRFDGPADGQEVCKESGLDNELNDECPSNSNDLDNECPTNLDDEQSIETASGNNNPEFLPEITPKTNNQQVPGTTFSMDNYSARDVDCWARTLSANQFEQLRILGPASRIESFRQYAITNLDQPTQTLTQKTPPTPQLNQEPLCHIPSEVADNQNQYVDSTSNDANNPFLHSHHVNH